MKLADELTISVTGCARCGGNHDRLPFRKLSRGTVGRNTHWATCPTNREPIMLRGEYTEDQQDTKINGFQTTTQERAEESVHERSA